VQLREVQCWFQSSTDKGQLAAASQTRLEQVGVGYLSSDKDTLHMLLFTRLVQVFWRVTPQLQKRVRLLQGWPSSQSRSDRVPGSVWVTPATAGRGCLAREHEDRP
jgi:hypothetical protein